MEIFKRMSHTNLPTKALTLHGPWAWAIVNGYKCVENREWYAEHRGPIFIHSGQSLESDESAEQILTQLGCPLPDGYPRGAIVGSVEIAEVLPLVDYLQKYGNRPTSTKARKWRWKERKPLRSPANKSKKAQVNRRSVV